MSDEFSAGGSKSSIQLQRCVFNAGLKSAKIFILLNFSVCHVYLVRPGAPSKLKPRNHYFELRQSLYPSIQSFKKNLFRNGVIILLIAFIFYVIHLI